MRYKTILGVSVLCLAISLGFNAYLCLSLRDKQVMINDMRSELIIVWVREMSVAGDYLKNAQTNIDMGKICQLFYGAAEIAGAAGQGWHPELYWRMSFTSNYVADNLFPYAVGYPTTLRYINSTAIEMFANLTNKIENVTHMVSQKSFELTHLGGADPIQLLEKNEILDDIIDGCVDIQNYSRQIRDFNPKFQ